MRILLLILIPIFLASCQSGQSFVSVRGNPAIVKTVGKSLGEAHSKAFENIATLEERSAVIERAVTGQPGRNSAHVANRVAW